MLELTLGSWPGRPDWLRTYQGPLTSEILAAAERPSALDLAPLASETAAKRLRRFLDSLAGFRADWGRRCHGRKRNDDREADPRAPRTPIHRTGPPASSGPPSLVEKKPLSMRYYLASKGLKGFSSTALTRIIYRIIGNLRRDHFQRNQGIPYKYLERTPPFVAALKRYGIAKPGIDALEIGTGWVHWESLMLRNQVDCRVLLYDVWDNRSFRKFRAYARRLTDPAVRVRLGLDDPAGVELMERVATSRTAAEAYALLGFEYLLDPSGTLSGVPEGGFDLVVSSDVGEHIRRASLPLVVGRSFRALRPGGWAYHQIVITDHLAIYDRSVHPKEYLRYSRAYYESRILSDIQYINLVQVPEWLDLFRTTGFEIVEMNRTGMSDLSSIEVHPSWEGVPAEDLACTVVRFILRRPERHEGFTLPRRHQREATAVCAAPAASPRASPVRSSSDPDVPILDNERARWPLAAADPTSWSVRQR